MNRENNQKRKLAGKKCQKSADDIRRYKLTSRQNNPGAIKGDSLKAQFGISFDQYMELFNKQDGLCAICKTPGRIRANKKSLHKFRWLDVDHCHVTQKIRGLLCVLCNSGIGKLGDEPQRLMAAIEYLESADTGLICTGVKSPDGKKKADERRKKREDEAAAFKKLQKQHMESSDASDKL